MEKILNFMKRRFFILFFSIIIYACKKDQSDTIYSNGNQAVVVQLDSFPMTIGHRWEYYTEAHITDSVGTPVFDYYYENYWNTLADTFINGIASVKIAQLDSNYDGRTHLSYSYYANKADGFYGMANENFGSMFFLRNSFLSEQFEFSLSNFGVGSSSVDTVFVPDTSLYLLKFPSVINDIWASHEYGVPNQIKRKWLGYERVVTDAGIFNCVKLQAFWDNDHDNQPDPNSITIYQYFSKKGLIKETRSTSLYFSSGSTGMLNQTSILKQINF